MHLQPLGSYKVRNGWQVHGLVIYAPQIQYASLVLGNDILCELVLAPPCIHCEYPFGCLEGKCSGTASQYRQLSSRQQSCAA